MTWLERRPVHQKVVGKMPIRDTYLGCGFDPQLAHVCEATNQCFSLISTFLSLSLTLPLSLKSINISSDKDKKLKEQKTHKT